MADAAREAALGRLRRFMVALLGKWLVEFDPDVGKGRWRLIWPADGGERDAMFTMIEGELMAAKSGGNLRLQARGRRLQPEPDLEWEWLPPSDLFSEVHPAPDVPPREVSRDANGEVVKTPLAIIPGLEVKVVTLTDRPEKANPECAEYLLELLRSEQQRYTTTELLDVISGQLLRPWCRRTLEATLAWLKERGEIDNKTDAKGRGYGLSNWKRE